jgi:hypothetical protein
MKQFITTLLAMLLIGLSLTGFSQINKGQWLIGGSADFNTYKYGSHKITNLAIAADGGYFFINRLAGGIRAGYDANYSRRDVYKAQNTFVQVFPFIRYYLLSPEQKINFFVDGGYGYSWGKYKSNVPYFQTQKWNSKIIAVKGGPVLFLNPHTSLELTLGYNHSLPDGLEDTLAANSFRVGVGFQIHLGKQKE